LDNSLKQAKRTLKGRGIAGGRSKGVALVSTKPLSFLGGVDYNSGIVIEKDHDLNGQPLKDRVLCFPSGHGSTVGSYVLYSLVKKGVGPKAIVNQIGDIIIVVGAIISEIPLVDQIDISQIKTGDVVEVDGDKGSVKIMRKDE
jgi:hypothetical protein